MKTDPLDRLNEKSNGITVVYLSELKKSVDFYMISTLPIH